MMFAVSGIISDRMGTIIFVLTYRTQFSCTIDGWPPEQFFSPKVSTQLDYKWPNGNHSFSANQAWFTEGTMDYYAQKSFYQNDHILFRFHDVCPDDICPQTFAQRHFSIRCLPMVTFAQMTFAQMTFAQKDICPEDICPEGHLPWKTYAQKDICPEIHLPRKTFALKDICPERHLPTRPFAQKMNSAWSLNQKTFAHKYICPQRHLPRKTIAQKDLCQERHLPRWYLPRETFAQKDNCLDDICSEILLRTHTIINPKYIYQKYNLIYKKIHCNQ
jgi:hypothetical protein